MNESSHALTEADRRALRQQLRAKRDHIIAAWSATQFDPDRLTRWNIAGVDAQITQALKQSFIGPLFDLLVGWLATGQPQWRALYRDERLRYAPHQAPPQERARFFAEILPQDEAAVLALVPAQWRQAVGAELTSLHSTLVAPKPAAMRVLAVGDCLMNEIRVFLPDACRDRGFEADVRCLYFSAVVGRDISTAQVREFLAKQPMDVLAFSFLSYEALPLYSMLLRDADAIGASEMAERVTAIVGLIRRFLTELREITDAPFLLHNASGLPLTRWRRLLPGLPPMSAGRERAIAALNTALAEMVLNTPNTILIDEAAVANTNGHRASMLSVVPRARDAMFHTARFGQHLSADYADVLASFEHVRKAKVLAVDFDNTLWSGVMADGDVAQHHDRQKMLKAAKDGGMLLVAVSKNDPANIRWNEMTLAPDDFVLQKIGWDLKVESISAAASQLDLGIDSFVFLDDNHAELELVRSQLPKVRVLDANDAFTWRTIERLLAFPNTKDTAEARARTQLYREQAQRQEALGGSFDYAAMMANLGLSVEFRYGATQDLDRITELVQRTNQFNTTTKRYTRQQLQRFLSSDHHALCVAGLSDRFGNLGLVAVAIVEFRETEAVFDSFIMSCRAMGFQLEHALLRLVLDTAPHVQTWRGLFVPTDRNTPAASLYPECGFTRDADGEWVLPPGAVAPSIPTWFKLSIPRPTRQLVTATAHSDHDHVVA